MAKTINKMELFILEEKKKRNNSDDNESDDNLDKFEDNN